MRETDIAEQTLINALSRGLNANYGYSGIKMNVGVVKSDQGQSTDAHSFYDVAMNDVLSEIDSSVIAPEVYYNISWENYVNSELSNALSNVNETISHIKVND